MSEPEQRAHHDMGGVSKYLCEKVDISPHGLTAFDREVDALRQMLSLKGLLSVDELRRGIEALPPDLYDRLPYYQKWLRAITATLLRKGVLDEAELQRAIAAPPAPA